MGNFTFEEMNLMCIYNTGSRTGLIDSLNEMRGELSQEETELQELTDSTIGKLQVMTDEEFTEKAPSHLILSACIRFIFNCSDLVKLCQTLHRKIRGPRGLKSPTKIPPKLLSGCPIF